MFYFIPFQKGISTKEEIPPPLPLFWSSCALPMVASPRSGKQLACFGSQACRGKTIRVANLLFCVHVYIMVQIHRMEDRSFYLIS